MKRHWSVYLGWVVLAIIGLVVVTELVGLVFAVIVTFGLLTIKT